MFQENTEHEKSPASLLEEIIAHVEDDCRDGKSYDEILAGLNFDVEKHIPSYEALELLNYCSLSTARKVDMLLAALGEKPAAAIVIGSKFWSHGDSEQAFPQFEVDEAFTVAKELGLKVHTTDHPATNDPGDGNWQGCLLSVSLSENNAALLNKVFWSQNESDELITGKVLGFPDSATAAYVSQEGMIPVEDVIYETQDDIAFRNFRFSIANAQNEQETIRRWARAIRDNDETLYEFAHLAATF